MAYTKTTWVNDETPINADNLNKIENELESLEGNISDINDDITTINGSIAAIPNKREKYNLVTNGDAVETGRKINGYTEYVKRISTSVTAGVNKTFSTGLTNGRYEITNYEGIITNFSGTNAKVRDGFYNGGNNYFSLHSMGAATFYVILGSDTSWVSGCSLYVNIYYIDLNENLSA